MPLLYGLIAFVVISIIIAKLVPVLDDWPLEWLVPARAWVTDFFVWFSAAAKPVTRAISWVLAQPLALVEAILYRGVPIGICSPCRGSQLFLEQVCSDIG